MQRLAVSIAFLSVSSLALMPLACAPQECASLDGCSSGLMCSADGMCVTDTRDPALSARGGNGVGVRAGDLSPQDGVDVGEVVAPNDAIWAGRIGPVGGFDGPATLSMWNDAAFGVTTINVTGESNEGYGLFILNLVNDGTLPVGAWNIDADAINEGGSYVQLCSDTEGGQHFDGIPEQTVVDVTPNDEGFLVDVKSTITNGFDGYNDGGGQPTVIRVSFQLAQ